MGSFEDEYSQCISPHGCTFAHCRSQHRCKQSCHGKQQPGSYRLNAQRARKTLLEHWDITISESRRSGDSWWFFTWWVLDVGNDLVAVCVHRNKIVGVGVQHQPPATHKLGGKQSIMVTEPEMMSDSGYGPCSCVLLRSIKTKGGHAFNSCGS